MLNQTTKSAMMIQPNLIALERLKPTSRVQPLGISTSFPQSMENGRLFGATCRAKLLA
jgi:hypothetical protein